MSTLIQNPDTQSVDTYNLLKQEDAKEEAPATEDLLAEEPAEEKEEVAEKEDISDDDPATEGENLLDEDHEIVDDIEAAIQVPVKVKDVLAKYPNLKKEFPELFTANFREKQYAELLPTIEDAKLAVERSETLAGFEKTVFEQGEIAPILSAAKAQDPVAFSKIVNGYLPQLKRADEGAYWHVVGSIVNDVAKEMFQMGQSGNNEDLQNAAQQLYNYVFRGGQQPKQYGDAGKPETEEMRKLKKEREEFESNKLSSVRGDIERVSDNSIKSTIDKNIDPKGVMSPYVKRNAINDCLKIVKDSMSADKRYTGTVDAMWKKAKENGYKTPEVENIKRLVLGKARSVLREAIISTRNEALKGISQKQSDGPAPARKHKIKDTAPEKSSRNQNGTSRKSTFELLSED
jgi:hypothetical protein